MIIGNRIPADLPRILVSANEGPDLIKFAANMAKNSKAAIVSLYVQPRPESGYNNLKPSDREPFSLSENTAAREALHMARMICDDAGVPVLQIYAVHNNLGEMLLDHAATWGVEAVVMNGMIDTLQNSGQREAALQKVSAELPRCIPLILHGE